MSSSEFLNDLDITPVIEYYDGNMPYIAVLGSGWRTMRCPFTDRHSHNDRSASARTNGYGFMCHGCGMKGGAIKLIMEKEGEDFVGALAKYEAISGRSIENVRRKTKRIGRRKVSLEPGNYERGNDLFSVGVRRKRPLSGA